MKIIFDSVIFQLQKKGGASNYWLEFFKRFQKSENCYYFLSSKENYLNKEFLDFIATNEIQKLPDKRYSGKLLRVFNPPKIQLIDNGIFHSTVYRWCKNKNIKNIITLHDFTHQKYMKGYHKILNTFLKRRAIKHADGIVCISQNTYKDLLEFYPKAEKKHIKIIYNGFNDKVFYHIENIVIPEQYQFLEGKKFLLFVGQREGYKNFDFMLKILEHISNLNLVVVGGKELDEKVLKTKNLSSRIYMLRNVSDSDLNVLYHLSYCFVYPSLYEGFGIPICEAMNCGCPVIAFNNSSIPEVMNGAGILLENNDIEGVIAELHKLDNEEYRNQIISAQYTACKKFSWDIAYMQMKNFYEEVGND